MTETEAPTKLEKTQSAVAAASEALEIAALRSWATERGHCDAKIAGDHARAGIQALQIVNGAAASAVLAFATNPNAPLGTTWPIVGLGFFAAGVMFACFNFSALTRATVSWVYHWDNTAKSPNACDREEVYKTARAYEVSGRRLFSTSLACFLFGCGAVGLPLVSKTLHLDAQHVQEESRPPASPTPSDTISSRPSPR